MFGSPRNAPREPGRGRVRSVSVTDLVRIGHRVPVARRFDGEALDTGAGEPLGREIYLNGAARRTGVVRERVVPGRQRARLADESFDGVSDRGVAALDARVLGRGHDDARHGDEERDGERDP